MYNILRAHMPSYYVIVCRLIKLLCGERGKLDRAFLVAANNTTHAMQEHRVCVFVYTYITHAQVLVKSTPCEVNTHARKHEHARGPCCVHGYNILRTC